MTAQIKSTPPFLIRWPLGGREDFMGLRIDDLTGHITSQKYVT